MKFIKSELMFQSSSESQDADLTPVTRSLVDAVQRTFPLQRYTPVTRAEKIQAFVAAHLPSSVYDVIYNKWWRFYQIVRKSYLRWLSTAGLETCRSIESAISIQSRWWYWYWHGLSFLISTWDCFRRAVLSQVWFGKYAKVKYQMTKSV